MDLMEGYHIYTSGEDQILNLSGLTVDATDWETNLLLISLIQ